jgi:TATA-box binding protein (TBP) (component of TFIID and TFIIIB)
VIGFDMNKLYKQLKTNNYDCNYDPSTFAGMYVVYNNEIIGTKVSIYIFRSGHILTTGATRREHITEIYKFINELIHIPNLNSDSEYLHSLDTKDYYDLTNINMEIEI